MRTTLRVWPVVPGPLDPSTAIGAWNHIRLGNVRTRGRDVAPRARVLFAPSGWLDPTEGQQYGFVVRALLTTYVLYSAVIAALSGLSMAPPFLDRLPNHVVDLAAVSGVVLLSAGSSCPLLPLFIFVLLEASLRWHRRGTVWTAIGTLGVFTVIGGYQRWAQPASFELNEFLIRCASLVVIAIVLDQVGTYERQLRRHVHALATEVDAPLDETDRLVSALLDGRRGSSTRRAPSSRGRSRTSHGCIWPRGSEGRTGSSRSRRDTSTPS